MNKLIIGIVMHEEIINNKIYECINKNVLNHLTDCLIIPIIFKENIFDCTVLDLCDGIIIPGGSDIYDYHYEIVKYCINKNKPLLGICMGCQIIGLYSNKNNKLERINEHYHIEEKHYINIDKKSNLAKIFGNHYYVNSRHLFRLNNVTKPFKIVAKADDNTIEAIELINNKCFILGVQWHPEDMEDMDKLYKFFVNEIKRRKVN